MSDLRRSNMVEMVIPEIKRYANRACRYADTSNEAAIMGRRRDMTRGEEARRRYMETRG